MIALKHAFRTEALSLGDAVGIFSGSADPATGDTVETPAGSLYLRTDGRVYQKVSQPDHWQPLVSAPGDAGVRALATLGGSTVPFWMLPDPLDPGQLLSVNTEKYHFFRVAVFRYDFLDAFPGGIGVSGWRMPFDGLVYGITVRAEETGAPVRTLRLLINGDIGASLLLPPGTIPREGAAFGLAVPFDRGAMLKIQDQSGAGAGVAKKVRCLVWVRWRMANV